jgi:hypothetical protein
MTGCTISSLLGTGAQAAGQIAAGSAISSANNSAITNQQNYLGNVQSIYGTQQAVGNSAMNTLGATLGTTGCAPNYSAFMNMPGYQFAQQQGQQAGERQAAAMGNAGNSGTAAMIGNQVTGTAMQDYNTYVSQLQNAAGLGTSANQQLGNITYNTGANTSQLISNTGMAQAGEYTNLGQTVSSGIGNLASGLTNTSGTASTGCPYGSSYNAAAARSGCGLSNGSIGTNYNQTGLSQATPITDTGIQPITGDTDAMLAGTGCPWLTGF